MKVLKFIFSKLNKLSLKKIRILCILCIVFSLAIGCSSNEDQISNDQNNSYNVDNSSDYELTEDDEEKVEEVNEDIEESSDFSDEQDVDESSDSSYDYDEDENISSDDQDYDSRDYDTYDYSEEDYEDEHIGEEVYIANGNSYYHNISNCKYLEGAKTQKVVLSSDMGKYECNCFTNPVEYKGESEHHSENHNSSKKNSSGKKVYIAKGNSYYHKSANCKFIKGADVSKVDISDVGGKHPCNCIKY